MRKNLKILIGSVCIGTSFIGCSDIEAGVLIGKKNEVIEIDTEKLKPFKDELVGNNSQMVALVNSLPGNIFYKDIELQTDKKPYGIKVNYNKNGIDREKIDDFKSDYREKMKDNAREMFIHIKNLDYINFNLEDLGFENLEFKKDMFNLENKYGKKVLNIHPYESIGNFKLGMKDSEVLNIIDNYRDNGFIEFSLPSYRACEGGDFDMESFSEAFVYYNKDKRVIAVEFMGDLNFALEDIILTNNYKENLEKMKTLDSSLEIREDGFTSNKYGIGMANEESIGIIFFEKGYYN